MPTFEQVLANTDSTTHTNRLHAAWDAGNADPARPGRTSAKLNYPTKTGKLRPPTSTNTEGVG